MIVPLEGRLVRSSESMIADRVLEGLVGSSGGLVGSSEGLVGTCDPINEYCDIGHVGLKGKFRAKVNSLVIIIKGVVMFLSYCRSEGRSPDCRSVSYCPVNSICSTHNHAIYSIKTEEGKFYITSCQKL